MQKNEKAIEILTQEVNTLNSDELHELFLFYYKINYQHFNLTTFENFNEFLSSFDKNPFRQHDDKAFKKQLIDSLVEFTDDYMSLITAVILIKRKFTIAEIIENYYATINAFDNNLF